ncbi:calcium-binding protein [Noviherbaspirillum sp.]|uniref:calcium-binding protein n=1 Tax=Noviherbaspirillum sp. TaxID=1926288 RepID=UPI002B481D60|nr:calcium-binding protein [Noviherbaspirillum sp.]HJV80758.1 calcium-binding protein [Noviherbaspirillum sp.]
MLKNGQVAVDGFAAMADLDTNGDGKLDVQDSAWSELKVWLDKDSNGITDEGELKTLEELTLQNWFFSDQHKVERVEFSDGTVWGIPDLVAASLVATAGSDYLGGAGEFRRDREDRKTP